MKSQKQKDCSICFEPRLSDDFYPLPCRHRYCKSCLCQHIESSLYYGRHVRGIVCPSAFCDYIFSPIQVEEIAGLKWKSKYEAYLAYVHQAKIQQHNHRQHKLHHNHIHLQETSTSTSSSTGNVGVKRFASNGMGFSEEVPLHIHDNDMTGINNNNNNNNNNINEQDEQDTTTGSNEALVRWCPKTDCNTFVILSSPNQLRACCNSCNTDFCCQCNNPTHSYYIGCRLYEWSLWAWDKEQRKVFFFKWRHTRNCPHCKQPIQKIGGCNRVHCTYCLTSFCWQCGHDFSQGEEHCLRSKVLLFAVVFGTLPLWGPLALLYAALK